MKCFRQMARFGAVGAVNTLIDYGLFNLLVVLTGIHSGPLLGIFNLAAVALATTNSYCLNNFWTFQAGPGDRARLSRFIIAAGLGALINTSVVTAVGHLADWLPISSLVTLNIGKALGSVLSVLWNFMAYRHWVFVTPENEEPVPIVQPGLVSVIVPAYNEAVRMPTRLRKLAESLPHLFPVEIIVVDDGSQDNTLEAARQISLQFSCVRYLGHPSNRGKGAAVQTGMRAATGEFLVFTDADNTFSPEHIALIVQELQKGHPLVIGSRFTDDRCQRLLDEPWLRRIQGKIFNYMVQVLLLPGMKDTQCGLKGFHHQVARRIFPRQTIRGFAFDVELLALASDMGIPVKELPITDRSCSGSKVRWWLPFQMAWDLLKIKTFAVMRSINLKPELIRDLSTGVALVVIALMIRLPWLWMVPRYIDELKEVHLGYLIYLGQVTPLHNVAHDIGALHNYVLALLFRLLGPSIYWPRLYVAVTSAITVWLVFLLGRRLYGLGVGLLAAGFLLTNGMHVMVSHMAWANSTTPFFFCLALLATVTAEQKGSGPWLAASAFLWALTLQTHSSVIVYCLVFLVYVTGPRFRRETGISLQWYLSALAAFVAGYWNMLYFNLVSGGGSILFITHKTYALETHPGLASYISNAGNMLMEVLRTLGSTYTTYNHPVHYLHHPLFLAAGGLLLVGIYFVGREKGSTLPLWMSIAAFSVFPWINHRYAFFLSTRYIMPVIICAILLMSLAVVRLGSFLQAKTRAREAVLAATSAVALTLIMWQIVPFYQYCQRVAPTNQSNRLALTILTDLNRVSSDQNATIILDKRLPLENSPLSYLLSLERRRYLLLGNGGRFDKEAEVRLWVETLQDLSGQKVIACLSSQTFQEISPYFSGVSVKPLTCQVTLPHKGPRRIVYLIETTDKPKVVSMKD